VLAADHEIEELTIATEPLPDGTDGGLLRAAPASYARRVALEPGMAAVVADTNSHELARGVSTDVSDDIATVEPRGR